ncbi:MAG: carbohydrate binding domain-containing protein [Lachnospiraceae bacterium]|nr:carbohydrate binding domain-containing protein [Lachnospiraceae bacterium]
MIGIFFEDINYGLDGGLNAQLIENRNFETLKCDSEGFGQFSTEFDGLYGWKALDDKIGVLTISDDKPLTVKNPHYLVFEAKASGAGFSNKAYDGIYLKKNAKYDISFYAKAEEDNTVTVAVLDGDKAVICHDFDVKKGDWTEYKASLTSDTDLSKGTFAVCLKDSGCISFDFFSMKPADSVLGLFRKDLAELLRDLKPEFLRFPGGCVVEGSTLESRYWWKRTVGPVIDRPYNWSRWAVHTSWLEPEVGPYHYYGQTYEIGFYEYFLLCEYLGCKPLPVVGVGLACQFQTLEKVDLDDPVFEEYIQDALDLIEFANGSVDTVWGGLRASMGHPQPFNMEMIGVGNEQWEDENSQFFERYRIFEKRIHDVYPEMKCIGTAGPDVSSDKYTRAWEFIREESAKNSNFVYAVDEHYYVNPDWLISNNHFYDDYSRDIKVFAGEYACHLPDSCGRFNREDSNTFYAALAEAAFVTGLERNSDLVVMASYAPLLSRIGYSQWSPNMIWFDGGSSYATPSYHVQKLFSINKGEYIKEYKPLNEGTFFTSAVKAADGSVILKAVNVGDKEETIDLTGLNLVADDRKVKVTVLAAGKDDVNSISSPDKVSPVESEVEFKDAVKVAPLSLKVIVIK